MKKIGLLMLIALSFNIAYAQSTTGAMKSSASIAATCAINSTNLTFGNYNPGSGDSFSTGNINFTCTKGISVVVGINLNSTSDNEGEPVSSSTPYSAVYTSSNGSSQSWTAYMTNGSNMLYYNIFQDSSHSKVFGGTTWFPNQAGTQETFTATGATQTVIFYGAMGGNQYVSPGTYSATGVAVITY